MKAFFVAITLGISMTLVGCGGGAPSDQPDDIVPVSGKVTQGGNAVANATVTFSPSAGGRPSSGTTDESGEYTLLYSASAKGAVPGEHIVTVSLNTEDDEASYGTEDGDGEEEAESAGGLPASASDGSIKKTVKADGGPYNIEL